jgi:exodeoxyribonuclease VII small subunit
MASREKTLKQQLAEFEELVAWFDGDELDVELAVEKYEQGVKLAADIKKQLTAAKNRIEVVQRKFDD